MEFPRETPVCLGVRAISRDWTPTRDIGPRSPAYNPRTRGGPAAAISVSSCAPQCGQLAGLVAPEHHSDGLPWTPRSLLVMAVSGSNPLVGFSHVIGCEEVEGSADTRDRASRCRDSSVALKVDSIYTQGR